MKYINAKKLTRNIKTTSSSLKYSIVPPANSKEIDVENQSSCYLAGCDWKAHLDVEAKSLISLKISQFSGSNL